MLPEDLIRLRHMLDNAKEAVGLFRENLALSSIPTGF
jgi:hypothetical protein